MFPDATFCSAKRKTALRTFAILVFFQRKRLKSTQTRQPRRYTSLLFALGNVIQLLGEQLLTFAFLFYFSLALQLLKQIHKVNEELKKYSHVNKKAFEQYSSFTKQRDSLNQRKEELDASDAAIRELIQTLDQRKDEAIERTFKQVAKNFSEVFLKLVPAGRGQLIMQRKVDQVSFFFYLLSRCLFFLVVEQVQLTLEMDFLNGK